MDGLMHMKPALLAVGGSSGAGRAKKQRPSSSSDQRCRHDGPSLVLETVSVQPVCSEQCVRKAGGDLRSKGLPFLYVTKI